MEKYTSEIQKYASFSTRLLLAHEMKEGFLSRTLLTAKVLLIVTMSTQLTDFIKIILSEKVFTSTEYLNLIYLVYIIPMYLVADFYHNKLQSRLKLIERIFTIRANKK